MYAKGLEQRTRYTVEPSLSQVQVWLPKRKRLHRCQLFALPQLSENAIHEHDDVLNITFMA